MRHEVRTTALALAAGALLVLSGPVALARPASGEPANPSCAPTSTLSPSPSPSGSPGASATASPQLVAWATGWHRVALRARVRLVRLRACLGRGRLCALPHRPSGDAASGWAAFGARCKRLDYRWYNESKRDWRRIAHPQPLVSAVQWKPLLRYVGWPVSQLDDAVTCIRRESGGRPWASNGFCFGLFQVNECHHLHDPFNPLVNCRYALQLWRADGWRDWTTMRGCR
jgi:hypothetical protein